VTLLEEMRALGIAFVSLAEGMTRPAGKRPHLAAFVRDAFAAMCL
jgi:hypothetical protein